MPVVSASVSNSLSSFVHPPSLAGVWMRAPSFLPFMSLTCTSAASFGPSTCAETRYFAFGFAPWRICMICPRFFPPLSATVTFSAFPCGESTTSTLCEGFVRSPQHCVPKEKSPFCSRLTPPCAAIAATAAAIASILFMIFPFFLPCRYLCRGYRMIIEKPSPNVALM